MLSGDKGNPEASCDSEVPKPDSQASFHLLSCLEDLEVVFFFSPLHYTDKEMELLRVVESCLVDKFFMSVRALPIKSLLMKSQWGKS